MAEVIVEFRRLTRGPSLVIEEADRLALDFFVYDPSSAPGGYDDLAGRGDRSGITTADIIAINSTMRDAVALLIPSLIRARYRSRWLVSGWAPRDFRDR